MNQAKEFFSKNKKVVIPVAIVLLLLIIAAICFGARSCARKDVAELQSLVQAENTNAPAETDSATPDASQAAAENTAANGTQSGEATPATPAAGTTASGGNSSSAATPSGGNSGSANTASHTHTWVNHTATKQVWVPKMVTVDDYETKKIPGGQLYTLHSDGNWYSDGETYWFYTDADFQAFKALIVNKVKNEGYCGNYVNRTKTEKTKVGSHQEDHGHYETYVDYYYCDCGARK